MLGVRDLEVKFDVGNIQGCAHTHRQNPYGHEEVVERMLVECGHGRST